MVELVVSLMIGFVPLGVAALADEEKKEVRAEAHVTVIGDEDPQANVFVWTSEDGDFVWNSEDGGVWTSKSGGTPHMHAAARVAGKKGCAVVKPGCQSAKGNVILARGGHAGGEEQGWLGVQIGATKTKINGEEESASIVVMNVVEGSPAEAAGLTDQDQIISINGEEIGADLGSFVSTVKGFKPGDTVSLVVLRDGDEQTVDVELGSRSEAGGFAWKFDSDHLVEELEDRVFTHGKMVFRGDDGSWQLKDLGDLSALAEIELPAGVAKFLPRSGAHTVRVDIENGQKVVESKVVRDGETLIVSQEGDGDIVVTRIDEEGGSTTETYASAEDLSASDEEAFDIYDSVDNHAAIHLDGDFDFDFDFDLGDLHEHLSDIGGEIAIHLDGANATFGQAMQRVEEVLGEDGTVGQIRLLQAPFGVHSDDDGDSKVMVRRIGRARQTFEVRPDGTIEVRVRKGDSELVDLYDGAADLERRNPAAYEKFQDLRSVE